MIQEKVVEEIVRKVLQNMSQATANSTPSAITERVEIDAQRDYPLATKRPDLLKTPTGKSFAEITLEKVTSGEVKPEDVRITPETLRMQAQVAEGVRRYQFADNLRRAAELTAVPDERILEIYNALRPYRSTKQELLDIAEELESKYNARLNAAIIKEAAEVYERRNRLKAE